MIVGESSSRSRYNRSEFPTQTRLPAAERKVLLMHHAIKCFAKSSYHSTSMDEIALASGVTKPVIYQHFSSKRDLYASLIYSIGKELCRQIKAATESAESLRGRVENGYLAYFRFAAENRAGYELLFGAGPRRDPEFRQLIVDIEEEISDLVTSKIEADIDEAHRRFLALGVISLAEGTVRRWLGTLDPKQYPRLEPIDFDHTDGALWARRSANLIWAGLRSVQREDPYRI